MAIDDVTPIELDCAVQQYAWGKIGMSSAVARFASLHTPIDTTAPYAELWMGTHPNGPSRVRSSGALLRDYLKGTDLPYLFKILSVNTALSIQAHPDKRLADQLHRSFPEIYKDGNHKPEMALALTPFEALCGFRPHDEIAFFLENVPALRAIVGSSNADSFVAAVSEGQADRDSLKTIFSSLMNSEPDDVVKQLKVLLADIDDLNLDYEGTQSTLNAAMLVTRLSIEYPNDVGVFCVFFLNALALEPGTGMFLGANEPHAYLKGDCVECMACSDNVVRAGLTPKFRDVQTLCDMLTYDAKVPQLVFGEQVDQCTVAYPTPIAEFFLTRSTVPPLTSCKLDPSASVSIAICAEGFGDLNGTPLVPGTIVSIPSHACLTLSTTVGKQGNLVVYRCATNSNL